MNNYMINEEHLKKVSCDLRKVLESEIKQGNKISETWKGWPYGGYVIKLRKPFHLDKLNLKENLEYRSINDIHYWKAEIIDTDTKDILVCGFEEKF